ncbi:hypothetical protein ATCC90586_000828 [Pythium insidiosum]|nr:hypothetical protein ATCC90586_000828 [Pythium insidiosum]
MTTQRTQPNAICTAPEFMNLFTSKLRVGSLEERPLDGVLRILDCKRKDGVVYYLVDWQPTWETRNDVGSTLIATFEKARRAPVRKTFIEDKAVEAGK